MKWILVSLLLMLAIEKEYSGYVICHILLVATDQTQIQMNIRAMQLTTLVVITSRKISLSE